MAIEETQFWATFLSIIIPSGIAVFTVFFALYMQDRKERKRVFHAVRTEVIDNGVMMKALEGDLNKELELSKENKYSMTDFPTLYFDSWVLVKTRYLHTIEYDQYIKIMRYYAYLRLLNSAIEVRNNYVLQAQWMPSAKSFEGIDKDIQHRMKIVRKKEKEIEDVLKELL